MKKFSTKYKNNIIFFIPSIEDGGVEKNLILIANYFCKFYNVHLLTTSCNKKKLFNKNIKFITLNKPFLKNKCRLIKTIFSIFLFLRVYKEEFIIFSFQSNVIAIILSLFFKKKIIIRANSSPTHYAQNLIKRTILKFFYSFSEKVIVNSKEFKTEFFKYFNINAKIIYNPSLPIEKIKKLSNEKINFPFFAGKKNYKIITIGRLVFQKNHILLLKAIKNIKDNKNIRCLVIGKGDQKKTLKKYIKDNNLSKIIKIMNYQKNIYPYLRLSNLFVLTSNYEGLPNIMIEALSLNKEIVSTNCKTGPKEILYNGKIGHLITKNDDKKLTKIINLLRINKEYKINKILYKKSVSRFNFTKNLNLYKDVVDEVLK